MDWQSITAYIIVLLASGLLVISMIKPLKKKSSSKGCPGCGDGCGVTEDE